MYSLVRVTQAKILAIHHISGSHGVKLYLLFFHGHCHLVLWTWGCNLTSLGLSFLFSKKVKKQWSSFKLTVRIGAENVRCWAEHGAWHRGDYRSRSQCICLCLSPCVLCPHNAYGGWIFQHWWTYYTYGHNTYRSWIFHHWYIQVHMVGGQGACKICSYKGWDSQSSVSRTILLLSALSWIYWALYLW